MAKNHEVCGNKRRFWSEIDATIYAGIVRERYGKAMDVYRCPTCKGWHLTTRRTNNEKADT